MGLELGSLLSGITQGAMAGKQMQYMDKMMDKQDPKQPAKPAPISQAKGTPTGQQAPAPITAAQGTPTQTTPGSTAPAPGVAQQPAMTAPAVNQGNATGGLGIPAPPAQQAQATPGSAEGWSNMTSHYTAAQSAVNGGAV